MIQNSQSEKGNDFSYKHFLDCFFNKAYLFVQYQTHDTVFRETIFMTGEQHAYQFEYCPSIYMAIRSERIIIYIYKREQFCEYIFNLLRSFETPTSDQQSQLSHSSGRSRGSSKITLARKKRLSRQHPS